MYEKVEILIFIMIGIVGLCFIVAFINFGFESIAKQEACKSLGMTNSRLFDSDVCIDKSDSAHFVNIKCEGIFWTTKCTAQIIDIGDFRIVID